jgi:hypothetical protein
MHYLYNSRLWALLLCLCLTQAKAQSTFTQVKTILETKCAGSSCHQSGGNPSFDVTGTEAALYSQLVNGTVINPAASAKGDKLITPGYSDRSFLLRKIAHGLNENVAQLALTQPQEGDNMPYNQAALSKYEIELIRQWIMFGAPQNGNPVDTALITKYYSGKGKDDTYGNHAPPAAGQGFQIYVGKILVPPAHEDYYYLKYNPRLTSSIEIPKVHTMLPRGTHHFVIFKFQPGQSTSYAEGLRPEAQSSHASVLDGIGTGPNLWEYDLPPNSAYFWEQNTVLDLNLHIQNGLADTVVGADLYINVYTQPLGTAANFMLIRNYPVETIVIPPDNQEHEFVEVANDTNETRYWMVWQLYGHTHKYGTDYDIFVRNPNGTMGSQEYESWYSYEQGFNVGYHRYGVDATFRYYPDDALLQVDPRLGWIHRARYKNTTQDTVRWGLTSEEEMMVMGFQYIYGDTLGAMPTGIGQSSSGNWPVQVFPNPASNQLHVNYSLQKQSSVTVEMTDLLGKRVLWYEQKDKAPGNYLDDVDVPKGTTPGMYVLNIRAGNFSNTRRIVIE